MKNVAFESFLKEFLSRHGLRDLVRGIASRQVAGNAIAKHRIEESSMIGSVPKYKAVVSSDWSECLSPNGPFDPISFNYPELSGQLSNIRGMRYPCLKPALA
jgi:hypothetical protein